MDGWLKDPKLTASLKVTVHHEDGSYWCEVEDHPGLFATGDTQQELLVNLQQALILYRTPEPKEQP